MSLLASIGAGLKGFFTYNGVANSALKIVDKIAGTDLTPKEQLDFVLNWLSSTKHQSPARRFIAVAFTVGFALFGFTYLASGVTAYFYVFFASEGNTLAQLAASQNLAEIRVKPLLQLQNDSLVYAETTLKSPISIILGFYFAIGAVSKLRS